MPEHVNPWKMAGRVPKPVLVALALVALALLAAAISIRVLIERAVRVDQVEAAAEAALRRPLDADAVEVSALHGLVLRNVRIWDRDLRGVDTGLMLQASTVRVRPSWWKLLGGEFEVASVRILEVDLWARKRRGTWNWLDLQAELAAEPSKAPVPAVLVRDMRLHADAPGERYDRWQMGLPRIALTRSGDRLEVELDRFMERSTRLVATLDLQASSLGIALGEVPPEWLTAAGIPHGAEGLEADFVVTWAAPEDRNDSRAKRGDAIPETFAVSGTAAGRRLVLRLPNRSLVTTQAFRARSFSGRWNRITETWDATVEDLRLGDGEHPLRVTAAATGRGSTLATARVEWDGPIDRLLALVPASFVSGIQKFRPRGPTAGRLSWQARMPDRIELTALARGMAATVPAAITTIAGDQFPAEAVELSQIRGRIQVEGGLVRIDTVGFSWAGDAVTLAGSWRPGIGRDEAGDDAPEIASRPSATTGTYDLTVQTSSFLVDRISGLLPEGVGLSGRIGASLRVQPASVWGDVSFRDAVLRHGVLPAPVRLVDGTVSLAKDRRLTLEGVAVAAGSGRVLVSGSVATDESFDLEAELQGAELVTLAALGGTRFPDMGLKAVAGTLDGRVQARGLAARMDASGAVSFRNASLDAMGHTWSAISGPLKFDSVQVSTPGLSARLGEGTLRVSGSAQPWSEAGISARLQARLERIDAGGFQPFLVKAGYPDIALAGPLDADLAIWARRGAWSGEGEIAFRGTSVSRGDGLSIKDLAGRISVAPDRLVAREMTGTHLGALMRANGSIPLVETAPWSLTLALGKAKLDAYTEFLPEGFEAAGTAEELSLALRGPRRAPAASGTARLTGATLKLPFLAAPLSDVRGEASFYPDSFLARDLSFRAGRSTVRVSGGVERFERPIFRRVLVHAPDAQLADLIGLLHEADRPLPEGASVSGSADIDQVAIHGPIEGAEWTGAVVLKGAGIQLPGLKRGLTGVTGRVVFGDRRVKASSLAGQLGAAEARLEGEMELADPYRTAVRLAVREADLGDLFGALPKSEAAARVNLKGTGTIVTTLDFNGRRMLVTGRLTEGQAEALGMPFRDVTGSFRYDGASSQLALSDLAGGWAGGRAESGTFRMNLAATPWTYDLRARIRGIDLPRAMSHAGLANDGYAGKVDADLVLSGLAGKFESTNGHGTLKISQARFEPLQPIDGISRALRFDLFSRGTYETARGSFLIEQGVVRTTDPDHFLFLGRNYTLQARGYSSLEGEYAFNYACGLSAGLLGNVMSSLQIGRLFSVEGDGGVLRTAGTVQGKFGQPPVVTRDLSLLRTFSN